MIRTVSSTTILCTTLIVYLVLMMNILQEKNIPFDNGHVNVSSFTVNYEEYEGFDDRGELSFPNLPPNQWYMVDLFPALTLI